MNTPTIHNLEWPGQSPLQFERYQPIWAGFWRGFSPPRVRLLGAFGFFVVPRADPSTMHGCVCVASPFALIRNARVWTRLHSPLSRVAEHVAPSHVTRIGRSVRPGPGRLQGNLVLLRYCLCLAATLTPQVSRIQPAVLFEPILL